MYCCFLVCCVCCGCVVFSVLIGVLIWWFFCGWLGRVYICWKLLWCWNLVFFEFVLKFLVLGKVWCCYVVMRIWCFFWWFCVWCLVRRFGSCWNWWGLVFVSLWSCVVFGVFGWYWVLVVIRGGRCCWGKFGCWYCVVIVVLLFWLCCRCWLVWKWGFGWCYGLVLGCCGGWCYWFWGV